MSPHGDSESSPTEQYGKVHSRKRTKQKHKTVEVFAGVADVMRR
jgi:hypothetical protein